MFCIHCGAEIPKEASFCPECGKEAVKAKKEENAFVEAEAAMEVLEETAVAEEIELEAEELPEVAVCAEEAPVKKKANVALPVIIMGAALLLTAFISFVFSINFRALKVYIEHGMADAVRVQFTSLGLNFVKIFAQHLIGGVLFAVICLIRKNHLHKINLKDIIPACLFIITPVIFSRLASTYITMVIGQGLGDEALAAISSANVVLGFLSMGAIVSWLGLCVFVLARTGAKLLPILIMTAVPLVSFVVGIVLVVFAPQALRLFHSPPSIIDMSVQYLRISAPLAFISVFVALFFWWAWGSGKMWFVPACVYAPMQPILSAVLGTLGAYITVFALELGIAFVNVGTTAAYILGGSFILLFTIIGAVVSGIKQKKK